MSQMLQTEAEPLMALRLWLRVCRQRTRGQGYNPGASTTAKLPRLSTTRTTRSQVWGDCVVSVGRFTLLAWPATRQRWLRQPIGGFRSSLPVSLGTSVLRYRQRHRVSPSRQRLHSSKRLVECGTTSQLRLLSLPDIVPLTRAHFRVPLFLRQSPTRRPMISPTSTATTTMLRSR